ncbi:peptidoglycan D,D-transpeptidase FtsI family protein [Ruminiclostridium cellobioparum]|uniref:peptidoglycan D,D-transpeptidase FtsI family protein n=1 Tax=Ruminiclostridium cellobioparum TaxID=29355 RepID=UPI0028ACE274|nr:penicillin-binding transpeptidase domain-containing protein [Ruminiclostridium cellobioparum]
MLRRIRIILFVFLAIFSCLLTRLCYIQTVGGGLLSKEASAQRVNNVRIESVRGDFLDKNGIKFTGRTQKITAVLKPALLRDQSQVINQLCAILGLEPEKTMEEIQRKNTPILVEIDQETKALITSMNIEGVSFVNSLSRYNTDTKAKHLLGYLNKVDNVGINGLEKLFEKTLNYGKEDSIAVITDGSNDLLTGLGYRIIKEDDKKNSKLDIKLTLDYHIQDIIEKALDSRNLTGAIVVENVKTGDIVGICSKPDFDPNDIEKYLSNNKRPLFNRAVAQYNIGSVFKLVDLAAIFEQQPDYNMVFSCPGYIQIADTEFKCSSYETGGHGTVDINTALAKSCNAYFINMSLDLGAAPILNMCKKFGLGENTTLTKQGLGEARGIIPTKADLQNPGDIANMSIGQGQIMATPVQIADMVATIANGGIKNNVNLLDSVVNSSGNKVRDLRETSQERVISKASADRIMALMEGVISEGTGKKANMDGYGGAGGKTGSAETGQYIDGEKIIQAWFAGYFPAGSPKYSVAVFIEDGRSGGEAAAPIFAEIGSEIMKLGL